VLPVRLPGGHIVGASSAMNNSIVITWWYLCRGSTRKYLSNGTCIYNSSRALHCQLVIIIIIIIIIHIMGDHPFMAAEPS